MIWINGTFGVGKTTTARSLVGLDDGLRSFDPEWVGYMLRANLPDVEVADFQDLAPWRTLVPRVAAEVAGLTSEVLVAVQTVLVEAYWRELRDGLAAAGLEPLHVVLDCESAALRARIEADTDDPAAAGWRLDHVARFERARPWMLAAADLVVDVTASTADAAAEQILTAHRGR